MTERNDNYRKVIEILRRSEPDLTFPEKVENEVINRIKDQNLGSWRLSDIIQSLFGWIYIGWLRRSLTVAAVIIVVLFVYQQAFILKQVKDIREQMISIGNQAVVTTEQEITKRLTLYKISNNLPGDREIRITEKQLDQLLKSYNEMLEYRDLLQIIEEDPELKALIEKRLNDRRIYKPDI